MLINYLDYGKLKLSFEWEACHEGIKAEYEVSKNYVAVNCFICVVIVFICGEAISRALSNDSRRKYLAHD